MADRRLTPERAVRAGLTPTRIADLLVADTHLVRNNGKIVLLFEKSGAGIAIVTVQTPNTVDSLAIAERTVSVPATTGDIVMGPYPPSVYNDAAGDLKFTVDDVAGLTLAVVRV